MNKFKRFALKQLHFYKKAVSHNLEYMSLQHKK